MSMRPGGLIDVPDVDAELAEAAGLDARDAPSPPVRGARLDAGPWPLDDEPLGFGLLVVSGLLLRRVELVDRHSGELLGPTDIVRPNEPDSDQHSMVPSFATWRALTPVQFAVLDHRFAQWAGAHAAVLDTLLGRLVRRSRSLAFRLALVQMPRTSARLHFLFWHLADRYGTVGRNGVMLTLPLTQGDLAELVSTQRQSVSDALGELEEAGTVERVPRRGWLLKGSPQTFPEV